MVGKERDDLFDSVLPGGSAAAAAFFEGRTAEELLAYAAERFGRVAIACSMQKESSVILDLATRVAPGSFEVFTLDTGVLFEETRTTWRELERRFDVRIEGVPGDGPERLWERDPDGCCEIRKVIPLRERLAGVEAWVTGLRREQSPERATTPKLAWDGRHGLWKISPLADWEEPEVWGHIFAHDLPYHPLHDRGYASIGCSPCTVPGSGRDGRWSGSAKTECGLHDD